MILDIDFRKNLFEIDELIDCIHRLYESIERYIKTDPIRTTEMIDTLENRINDLNSQQMFKDCTSIELLKKYIYDAREQINRGE